MVNFCIAFVGRSDIEKIAVAAAFHDLGIWTNKTFDYIPPSIAHCSRRGRMRGFTGVSSSEMPIDFDTIR